jgi:hypothetical protein
MYCHVRATVMRQAFESAIAVVESVLNHEAA